jgi:hypothetical protein
MFWAEFFDGWFERWPEESNDVVDAQKLVWIVLSFNPGPKLIICLL